MAFDVLYADGEMTMERPLEQRRRVLEELVQREQGRTRVGSHSITSGPQTTLLFEAAVADDGFARLVLAPAVNSKAWPSWNRPTWTPGPAAMKA